MFSYSILCNWTFLTQNLCLFLSIFLFLGSTLMIVFSLIGAAGSSFTE
ncbi:hypothetical protein AtDm6_3216 [Acetobacter tropicalis]|uniref:Uncharacterized protein n=1 Tax=Acetobacter tropicalis TaxID=104102 RepID=A0A094ZEK1_9PROT|nr:hypothetical protein AtDm6_3216 [Acetobacter tropicalis]